MVKIATVLNKPEDVAHYQQVFDDTRTAFANRYLAGSQIPSIAVQPSTIRRQMDDADNLSRGRLQKIDYGVITSQEQN